MTREYVSGHTGYGPQPNPPSSLRIPKRVATTSFDCEVNNRLRSLLIGNLSSVVGLASTIYELARTQLKLYKEHAVQVQKRS